MGRESYVHGKGASCMVENAGELEGRGLGQVFDFAGAVDLEGPVMARVDDAGCVQYLPDARASLVFAPEYEPRCAAPDGPGLGDGVAADADGAGRGVHQNADVPPSVTEGLDEGYSQAPARFRRRQGGRCGRGGCRRSSGPWRSRHPGGCGCIPAPSRGG